MAFKKNGPGCCCNCDEVQWSTASFQFDAAGKVYIDWTVSAVNNTHKITSITIEGVEQLAAGEEVFTKSGRAEWNRGTDVPEPATPPNFVATNECGNTGTMNPVPTCCHRTTVSYREITGLQSVHEKQCTLDLHIFTGTQFVTISGWRVETHRMEGLDDLNGTYTDSLKNQASVCINTDDISASGNAGELYAEETQGTQNTVRETTGTWKLIYSLSGGFLKPRLEFHASSYNYTRTSGGTVLTQVTNAPTSQVYVFNDLGLFINNSGGPYNQYPPEQCLTPGSFGDEWQLSWNALTGYSGCHSAVGSSYNVTATCTGIDGTAAGGLCWHEAGFYRQWIQN